MIDLHEHGRLNICTRYGDTWAWIAPGLERQHVAAAGADEVVRQLRRLLRRFQHQH
ncbi:hypothetical protein Tco_0594326, partial [Tanacetum coccineum]